MNWANSIRIAAMPLIVGFVCLLLIFNAANHTNFKFWLATMCLGACSAVLPLILMQFIPAQTNRMLHHFFVLVVNAVFFVLSLLFATSLFWKKIILETETAASITTAEILKYLLPGFLFIAMAFEAVKYFISLHKLKKRG